MTIERIAKLADVSKATVSLVLNNKEGVGDDTRKRVQELIHQVGYVPKRKVSARNLKSDIRFVKYRKTGCLVERNGDFISRVIDGVEDAARKGGMTLKFTNVSSDNFETMIEDINRENDGGIIFLGTEFDSREAFLLKRFCAPVVVVDNEMKDVNIDAVVMNNEEAVFTALQYLNEMGHCQIGHIASGYPTDNFDSRLLGYRRSMEKLGLENLDKYTYCIIPEINDSYQMLLRQFRTDDLPTAFFADNDILAIGALRALKDLGISVPKEISIVGMDDLMLSSVSNPELTTLKIHKKEMGQLAVMRLIQMMSKEKGAVVKSLVGSEIIVRNSTASPPRK